jgi:hypothetical protein
MEAGIQQGPYTIIYDDGFIVQGMLDSDSVNTGQMYRIAPDGLEQCWVIV